MSAARLYGVERHDTQLCKRAAVDLDFCTIVINLGRLRPTDGGRTDTWQPNQPAWEPLSTCSHDPQELNIDMFWIKNSRNKS